MSKALTAEKFVVTSTSVKTQVARLPHKPVIVFETGWSAADLEHGGLIRPKAHSQGGPGWAALGGRPEWGCGVGCGSDRQTASAVTRVIGPASGRWPVNCHPVLLSHAPPSSTL